MSRRERQRHRLIWARADVEAVTFTHYTLFGVDRTVFVGERKPLTKKDILAMSERLRGPMTDLVIDVPLENVQALLDAGIDPGELGLEIYSEDA